MTDVLDFIRDRLAAQPLTPEAVESALSDARQTYGGDMPYIRMPKRMNVTKRTEQQRRKKGRP